MQETRQQKLIRLNNEAAARLKPRTTRSLIEIWEMLDFKLDMTHNKEERSQIFTAFQWVNTELENRNSDAWDAYLDSDEKSPRRFYL